jgi:hypothetical protein
MTAASQPRDGTTIRSPRRGASSDTRSASPGRGNPDPVQGPVEIEIAYGLLSGGGRTKLDWRDPAVVAASRGWLLLAQFDSDDQAGFMWGDAGVLYFMIRPDDLATATFDSIGFTWQCG